MVSSDILTEDRRVPSVGMIAGAIALKNQRHLTQGASWNRGESIKQRIKITDLRETSLLLPRPLS